MKKLTFTLLAFVISMLTIQSQEEIYIPEGFFVRSDIQIDLPWSRIYKVEKHKISQHMFVEGEVYTSKYKDLLNEMSKYENSYLIYKRLSKPFVEKNKAIHQIIENINKYERSENVQLLIDSQKLADNLDIIVISKGGDWGDRTLRLVNRRNRVSNLNVIMQYKDLILEQITDVRPTTFHWKTTNKFNSYEARTYIRLQEESNRIQKTEPGLILSEEKITRYAYIGNDDFDTSKASGTFRIHKDSLMIVYDSIKGIATNNELVHENTKMSYSSRFRYMIIENIESGQLFALNKEIVNILEDVKQDDELKRLLSELGYAINRKSSDYYIETKYYDVKANVFLYRALQKDKNILSKLDRHYESLMSVYSTLNNHNNILQSFVRQHRIQRINLPAETINRWVTATKNAQRTNDKLLELYLVDFPFHYTPKKSEYFEEKRIFFESFLYSKNYLRL